MALFPGLQKIELEDEAQIGEPPAKRTAGPQTESYAKALLCLNPQYMDYQKIKNKKQVTRNAKASLLPPPSASHSRLNTLPTPTSRQRNPSILQHNNPPLQCCVKCCVVSTP